MLRSATIVWLISAAVVAMLALEACAGTVEQIAATSTDRTLLSMPKKPVRYNPPAPGKTSVGLAFTYGKGEKAYTYGNTKAGENYASSHAGVDAYGSHKKHAVGQVTSIACHGSHCKRPESVDEENDQGDNDDNKRKLLAAPTKKGPAKKEKYGAPAPSKTSVGLAFTYGKGEKAYTYGNTKAGENYASSHAGVDAYGSHKKHAVGQVTSIACHGSHCKRPESVDDENDQGDNDDNKLKLLAAPAKKGPAKKEKYGAPAPSKNSVGLAFGYGKGEKVYTYGNTKAEEKYASSHVGVDAYGSHKKHAVGHATFIACHGHECKKPEGVGEGQFDRKLLTIKKTPTKKHVAPVYPVKKNTAISTGYVYGKGKSMYGDVKTYADDKKTYGSAHGYAYGSEHKHAHISVGSTSCYGEHCEP